MESFEETPQVNQIYGSTWSYKLIKFLRLIGVIPRTQVRLLITGLIQVFLIALAIWSNYYSYQLYAKVADINFIIMALLTDLILILNGAFSLLASNKLEDKFPDIISEANIHAPKRKWLLLLVAIIHILQVIGMLFWYILEAFEREVENWLMEAATNLPGPMIMMINGYGLLFSYLFYFGCIVSNYIKKTNEALANDGTSSNKYTVQIENVLKEYLIFQKSVSLGLFIILTLQTIAAIIVLYLNIVKLGILLSEASSAADMVIFWVSVLWSLGTCLVLVYLCLVANDVDNIRLEVIHNLW